MLNTLKNISLISVIDKAMIAGLCILGALIILRIMHVGEGDLRAIAVDLVLICEGFLFIVRCTTPKHYVVSQMFQVAAIKYPLMLIGVLIVIGFFFRFHAIFDSIIDWFSSN